MKRIACLIAALAVTLTGCDNISQMIGIVGAEYRPPLKTGAIKGKVVDRNGNALAGVKVTNGAAVYYTADDGGTVRDDSYDPNQSATSDFNKKHLLTLAKGEFVLTKVAGNSINYIQAEFDGQNSSTVQKYVTAAAFDASQKDADKQGLNVLDDIKIAVDEPVAADSKLIKFISTDIPDNIVTAASASATLQFDHSKAVIYLKAPPGGPGVTVQSSRVTYMDTNDNVPGDVTPNNVARTLPAPVTVLPGTKTQSGPLVQVDVPISNVNPTFIEHLRVMGEMKVHIKLYTDKSATEAVKDRATGDDLVVLLSLKYTQ